MTMDRSNQTTLCYIEREGKYLMMHRVKKMIADSGYSVSAGYTMRGGRDEEITEMLRVSDERMYADKAEYYRRIGRDRRIR